jgi:hypothetical protein
MTAIPTGREALLGRLRLHARAILGAFAAALVLGFTIASSARLAHAGDSGLPDLSSLADDAVQSGKTHTPILVLVSIEGCPYCERIRRQNLIPMSRQSRPGVLIREVDMHSTKIVTGLSNQTLTQAEFARQHGVRFAPTVLLLGPGGELLAEPLIGASIADFYGATLEERIRTAQAKLGQH